MTVPGCSHPDLAALYLAHRGAMYRVAAKLLRDVGLADQAGDVVQDAMLSLWRNPPRAVDNWEALMVATVRRRALDIIKSASVKHAGPELSQLADRREERDLHEMAEEIAEVVDREGCAVIIREAVWRLPERHQKVIWEYKALDRARNDIANELGVSPARVSQIAREALQMLKDVLPTKEVDS